MFMISREPPLKNDRMWPTTDGDAPAQAVAADEQGQRQRPRAVAIAMRVPRAGTSLLARGTLTNSSSTSGGDTHTSSAESAENSTQAAWAARLAEASTQKLPRLWQGAPRALLVWPAPLGLVGWWLWRAFSA